MLNLFSECAFPRGAAETRGLQNPLATDLTDLTDYALVVVGREPEADCGKLVSEETSCPLMRQHPASAGLLLQDALRTADGLEDDFSMLGESYGIG